MSIFDLFKAAGSHEELARKNADRHRPIGSVAYRNGEKVLWAGQRYLYQSPEMFKQLQDKGEFKFLNITGHQIREGALSIIPRETKDAVKEQISNTSKLLAEGDLALKDLSEVYNPGSTLAIEQRREKASQAVSAVTTPLSKASKWFSDKTNTAPWVSDEVGAALITGGTSLIARRFMQAAKLANTARKISSTADKVTTTANQARQLGKFSNNAIMRAKLGGAAAQRVKQSGSANLSNVADVLSLPKTGTQRPPLTSAAIVEKFKDKGFVPSGTLPLARQVAQVIKMDTQLKRVSKLKNPNYLEATPFKIRCIWFGVVFEPT